MVPPAPDGGVRDAGNGVVRDGGVAPVRDGGPADERYVTRIETAADLALVSSSSIANVKYLAHVEGATREPPLLAECYFQNMRMFEWHLGFLQSFPELVDLSFDTYLDWVLRSASRRFWGGSIRVWPGVAHPNGTLGVVSYEVYGEPGQITAENVIAADGVMKRCASFAADILVYVPGSLDQKALAQQKRAELEAAGVTIMFPEQLIDGLSHVAYSEGEGYGTLRVVPAGQRLDDHGPRDIVVVETSPNDISVVQGLITKDPQNPLSHTNLRLIEKDVPSVAVPRIYDASYLQDLDDQLVHLVVSEDRFVLEPARLEDAQAHWDNTRPDVPAPRADLTVTALESFEVLTSSDAIAYGAKAANIGELSLAIPAAHRPAGFGIPFAWYDAHVTANGIDQAIDMALGDPRIDTDAAFKRAALRNIREQIRAATIDPDLVDQVETMIRSTLNESARIRFRSSTNVEDLDVLTGAGLYDSKSGCILDDRDADATGPSLCLSEEERIAKEAELAMRRAEKMMHPDRLYLDEIIQDLVGDLTNERTVERAIKAVWASLWSLRAFDERAYYGLDHRLAYMGIAASASFVLERKSSVAITELNVDANDPLYRLSTQIGSLSVVRPEDPTAIPESLTFRRTNDAVADVNVRIYASLLGEGVEAWSRAELDTLGGLLFDIQDHFSTAVYPHLAPVSFDVEIKHTKDGDIVIKQVRPFISTGP